MTSDWMNMKKHARKVCIKIRLINEIRSLFFCGSSLDSSGGWEEVSVKGIVEVGIEWPSDYDRKN